MIRRRLGKSEYVRLLADDREFRRLWLADLLSLFGDWFNWIALYTAVDALLGTSQAVGWVIVAKSLPFVFASPIAGPLVDRLPARALMVGADLIRAVLGLVLVVAWWWQSVTLLFTATVLSILCSGVFLPAKNAAIPRIVPVERLGVANALTAGSWSITLAFGAALGGFVTDWLGVSAALALDAVTYVVSALLLLRLPALAPPVDVGQGTAGTDVVPVGGRFRDALAYLSGRPALCAMAAVKAGMACTSGALPMLTVFGNRVLSEVPSPRTVGVLFAARGIGAVIGSLGARRVFGDGGDRMRRMVVCGFGAIAVGYGLLSVSPGVVACAAALVVSGSGNSLVWVGSNVLIQTESDRRFHGRLFALDFGAMTLVGAVAVLVTTGLVDAGLWSPRQAVAAAGFAAVPVAVVLGFALRRPIDGAPGVTDRT